MSTEIILNTPDLTCLIVLEDLDPNLDADQFLELIIEGVRKYSPDKKSGAKFTQKTVLKTEKVIAQRKEGE